MSIYNDLEGKLKIIKSSTRNGTKVCIREESGIIISCKSISKRVNEISYKIEGISLQGKSFSITTNEDSQILDLDIDEERAYYLSEIRNSILRRREAQEIIAQERVNIDNLKLKLLSNVNAMTQSDFVDELILYLEKLDMGLSVSNQYYFGGFSVYIKTKGYNVSISIKKHHLGNIRVMTSKSIDKTDLINEIIELNDMKKKKEFINNMDKRYFLKKYNIENFFSKEYYDFLEKHDLDMEDYSNIRIDLNNKIQYLFSHSISKGNELFLNKDSIELIASLVNIINNCSNLY